MIDDKREPGHGVVFGASAPSLRMDQARSVATAPAGPSSFLEHA
jgi:hypothetical protein